jgi:protocatechuate 3,4-dioxygenase beta subunit
MLAALLFDPFFAAPIQQPALPDAVKQLGSISGVVTTTSGTPIAKAQVSLLPSSLGTPIATALSGVYQAPSSAGMQSRSMATGADGAFAFDMLMPGNYRLMVTHPSYLDPGGLGLGAGLSSSRAPVPLTAGQRVEDVRIELVEPGTVSGRVVDEDGDPVPQATIEVTRFVYSDGKRRLSATAGASSNDNGDFKVTRVPPGTYIVKTKTLPSFENVRAPIPAAKPGHLYNPNETYYGDTRIAGEALPVKVGAGQTVALGVIRMRNRALPTVRGKVTGDLSLLADAHVGFLLPDAGGGGIPSRYIADIQKDGSYAVANLWESAAGDAVTIGVDSRKFGLLAFTTIAVRAEGEEGVVLNVAAAPLSGSVRMEDDPAAPQPMPPMQVRLRALGQVAVIAPTAAVKPDGSFAIPLLAAGTYSAEVSGLPPGSYVKSVKLNGKESREQGMDWAGPGSGPLEVLISRKAAVLGGAVKDEDGNPVSGTVTLVPVPLRPGHPSMYPTATADESGVFRFAALTPGTYQVYAWEEIEPTAHWDPRFMDRFATRAETVELVESGYATVSLKRITAATEREALRSLPI